ncbi:MAG: DUF3810 domain-containing protein [Chitinophagia bacterium]|nr:DUF3810 domain-containing protein [Chitinophagia bacterium]
MPLNLPKTLKMTYLYAWHGLAILVFAFGRNPNWVSKWYGNYWFKGYANGVRKVLGSFPFALGEIVYFILIILLIYNILRWLFSIKNKIKKPVFTLGLLYSLTKKLAIIYLLFEMVWGLNYQKNSPAISFGLQVPTQYTEAQMDSLSLHYIGLLNQTRSKLDSTNLYFLDTLFQEAINAYQVASLTYPFLTYEHPNIKKAIFPGLGDKIGYLAFYQPLTSEAIIRGDLPVYTLPFTICHEMAHQLGYASESEANFIAYQVAHTSSDALLQYSMLLQMFTYSQQAHLSFIVKRGDFNSWKQIVARNKKLLSPQVLEDRKKIKAFFQERMGERIPGTEQLYDQFLIWNQQSRGIESYNDVLLWALAKPIQH